MKRWKPHTTIIVRNWTFAFLWRLCWELPWFRVDRPLYQFWLWMASQAYCLDSDLMYYYREQHWTLRR